MLAAKDMDKTVKGLEDLCAPSKRQFVGSVAKKVTEFSPGKKEYGRTGFCLKGAVEVLTGQTLMNDDDLAERKANKKTGRTMFVQKSNGPNKMTSPDPKM